MEMASQNMNSRRNIITIYLGTMNVIGKAADKPSLYTL